jgi:arylsulfatase A-like enzyme
LFISFDKMLVMKYILIQFCLLPFLVLGQQKPNIVWISVEDMSPRLSVYGDNTVSTPNINRLAEEGIVYDHVYTTAGVCSPSRCAIITGNYQTKVGGHNMRTTMNTYPEKTGLPTEYNVVPPDNIKCFPEYLRANGYYVSNNEKTDYQFVAPPTVWDESSNKAHWRNRKENQPFFSIFNIFVTHESQLWARSKNPLRVDPSLVVVPPYYPDTEAVRWDIARHYTNISEMDDQVGIILQQLEEDNLLDQTIIFFWSDHGDGLPFYKREIYKRGLHVPLIVRFPDKSNAGTRNSDLISAIDFGPSVLSLAGINTPNQMDGKAFIGNFKVKESRNFIFASRDRLDSEYDRVRSIMNKKYQFILNFHPEKPLYMDIDFRKNIPIMRELLELKNSNKLTGDQLFWFQPTKPKEEFYDVESDPYQLNNLIDEPHLQEIIKQMRKELKMWIKKTSDLGHISEKELVKQMWNNASKPPNTKNPELKIEKNALKISCATKGASIRYRKVGDQSWTPYVKPLPLIDQELEVVAMRIGYNQSDVIRWKK